MGAHAGSNTERLVKMAVGERVYVETTAENWMPHMTRVLVPRSRRIKELDGREFETSIFTAIGSKIGSIRYIICVERTK
jgi:hypothetical protein